MLLVGEENCAASVYYSLPKMFLYKPMTFFVVTVFLYIPNDETGFPGQL